MNNRFNSEDKIILAIDGLDLSQAKLLLEKCPNINWVKVGLELFVREGPRVIEVLKSLNKKIFLDLKFHDIPNTIYETILGFEDCKIDMLTVHLSGGKEMLKKAMLAGKSINAKVIGVSILTSLDEEDSLALFNNQLENQISNLFRIAVKANIDGIVCSPHELEMANTILGTHSIKITPGIRDIKIEDDQERTMSAKEAIERGSTFLVIGRPITQAEDIATALQSFNDTIHEK